MVTTHAAVEHHTSAAFHHDKAARYHREASRHFEVGKDYAHLAHKALVAHVHGLQAADRGMEASKSYAGSGETGPIGAMWSAAAPPSVPIGRDAATIQSCIGGAQHHGAAAEHHEEAEMHHRLAAGHLLEDDLPGAAHEAEIARSHARQAVFHGDEAAKHDVAHYGQPAPLAELS